jgi:hypothetical protein
MDPGILDVPNLSATIFVSGIGSGTFSDPTRNFDNDGSFAGFQTVGSPTPVRTRTYLM